jgi:hypothetical protein
LPHTAICEIYKWTNDDGTMSFTDGATSQENLWYMPLKYLKNVLSDISLWL